LASVSRSVAWIDFFQPQAKPVQNPRQMRDANRRARLQQLLPQLTQHDVRALLHQTPHQIVVDAAWTTPALLGWPEPTLGAQFDRVDLRHPAIAHPEPLRQSHSMVPVLL
jgi:hypothetical protein